MNKILFRILGTGLLSISIMGCSKMTEPEAKTIQQIGGYAAMNNQESEEYYANLREYKKGLIRHDRPVAFGWFSNWSPSGAIRKGYLSSLPDSIDFVSMWSGAPTKENMTADQLKDKEFAQKVKGIKLLEVSLLSYIGKNRTPEEIYRKVEAEGAEKNWSEDKIAKEKILARWNYWGMTSHDLSNEAEVKGAIEKYAKALYDYLEENEWDGFDIDWEIGYGVFDMDGTLTQKNANYLVEQLGKYMGPASDPERKGHKLLCIDGNINAFPKECDKYVDYWIIQSYGWASPNFYNPGGDPSKTIITENFEASSISGGFLLQQAAKMPDSGWKGGVGAYRLDNDYNNNPPYKWFTQAIRINQQVFNEWKAKQK